MKIRERHGAVPTDQPMTGANNAYTILPSNDGDNGLIRFTSNGGLSPWRTRFCGVTENLRKVVIIEVTHSGGGNGDHAVVIGKYRMEKKKKATA